MDSLDKRKVTSPINGQSGGVKTTEGKAISSQNSTKHGILSKYGTQLDDLSFDEVYKNLAEEFGDTTPSRQALISQLAVLLIRLRRCARFENEFIREKMNPPKVERTLVKRGELTRLNDGFEDEYKSTVVDPGEPMTLSPLTLGDLDNIYSKYEGLFLRQFCNIVKILTQGDK